MTQLTVAYEAEGAGPPLVLVHGITEDRRSWERRGDQEVVLGVWDLIFSSSVDELEAVVDQFAGAITVPYLSLHGIDPGDEYVSWLEARLAHASGL